MNSQSHNSCAVMGNPIEQSKSPQIHTQFAEQFGMDLDYRRILASDENFESLVREFFEQDGRGLNITAPFKERAFALADVVCPQSEQSRSCNTLYMSDGKLHATTTDGYGWLADINRLGIELSQAKILLLGAGGASRVLFYQLMSLTGAEEIAQIVVANRSQSRIEPLLVNSKVSGCELVNVPDKEYDLIINGLSLGLQNQFPNIDINIKSNAHAYDLNYGVGSIPFQQWFHSRGGLEGNFHDGWGMLVGQAARSFEIWWHKKPDVQPLISKGPETI